MNISSTDLNKRPGASLNAALRETVVVNKSGRPFVVMISYERYQDLEDAFWGSAAEKADKNAEWLGLEQTSNFLRHES